MLIYAKKICRHIHHLLNNENEIKGSVHSVFNRVCNITIKDWPITSIILDSIPMKPMAISFDSSNITSFHDIEIERGNIILYSNGKINIPQRDFSLCFKNAKVEDCRPLFNFDRGKDLDVKRNINELRYFLQQGNNLGILPVICCFEEFIGEKGAIIPRNRYSEFAWPRINKLINSIRHGDYREISNSTGQIAGFGPGLTPSADDLIIGIMISLIYASYYHRWENEYVALVNSSILNGSKDKTTQLSYEIMSFASKGEVTKNIHELMSCIYSNPSKKLYENIMEVMNYGETSGSDLLAGIYIGCKISSLMNQ